VADGKPDDLCFIPSKKGDWTITACDTLGRSSSVKIRIY
jgi:hypothetical protein